VQSYSIQRIFVATGLSIFALATGPAARRKFQTSVANDTRYSCNGDSIPPGSKRDP